MNTAILLCVALINAPPIELAVQVRAKVLSGSGTQNEQRAGIEPWIRQAMKESGSPVAQPYTNWIVLSAVERRLFTSAQGGFIIDGQASERNGKYEVEIHGCEGVPLRASVTLKPGERRVVNLTDNPEPNNVFIALAVDPPFQASSGRAGTRIRFLAEGDTTVFDIHCDFGIDTSRIKRLTDEWPQAILVRFHMRGLESFKVNGQEVGIDGAASSTDEKKVRRQDGYFEVPLPAKLFQANPPELRLEWIDFYRR